MPISLQLVNKPEKSNGKGPRRPGPKEKEAFSTEAAPQAPPAPIGNNRRVLVVDDNAVVLKAFELKLKADGFAVTTTTNSSAVASTAEQTQTELIVLDVNFPTGGAMEWNGFTVMQWLRRFPEMQRIPVILISGSDSAEYGKRALAAGAIAFFQKPVIYTEILEAMLKALGEKPASSPPNIL
jgi:two-component system KDP operon response regulator KdpE